MPCASINQTVVLNHFNDRYRGHRLPWFLKRASFVSAV
ncbi:unnamed protein product [Amoebophrya sp. A25]|nr:unnamed protein product [Amoebophrya sp. A25]|eukprot:GSA25T00005212001.1